MRLPSFTPQEIKAIIFILVCLVIGGGVTMYKKYHPDFAPELLLERSSAVSQKANLPSEAKETTDTKAISSQVRNQKIKRPNTLPKVRDMKKNKININTAALEDLELLPYIGPVLSRRIVSYREKQGGFKSIEELKKVRGIGEKTFRKIKDFVKIE